MENGTTLRRSSSPGLLRRRVVSAPQLLGKDIPKLSSLVSCSSSQDQLSPRNGVSQLSLSSLWDWERIEFSELPEWRRSNEYIVGSYRPLVLSFYGCFASIFRLHNETLNIWTHLVGFLLFGGIISGELTGMFEGISIYNLPWLEQLMLFLFFIGTMVCFLCSTLFHIFQSHSHSVSLFFSRLDYAGIAFLITSSSVPAYYYGFYCTELAKWAHISVLLLLCMTCTTIILRKKFNTPPYRMARFVVFSTFGLYGAIPFFHIYFREGYGNADIAHSMWGIVLMAATYIGGGALYAFRIPERFWPGKFDVWASSHQMFHLCVIVGSIVHYKTLFMMIKYRLHSGSCREDYL